MDNERITGEQPEQNRISDISGEGVNESAIESVNEDAENFSSESGEAKVDYSLGKGISTDIYGNSSKVTMEDLFGTDASFEEEEFQDEEDTEAERMQGSYSSIYNDSEGGGIYNPIPDEPVKKKRSFNAKKLIAGALLVCLCFGAGFSGAALGNRSTGGSSTSNNGSTNANATSVSIKGDVESLNAASAIAEKMMPSVVGISTVSQTLTDSIYGLQSGTSTGIGTGLIFTEDGYILTNSHVVNDGNAETITVDLYDGTEYEGKILWNDSNLDLAIVKIEATGLQAAEIGDSDTVQIGDYALAIGNPLGLDFERSVTSGIISGLNRSITVANTESNSTNTMEGLIQTDASINSGNSGGPLINSAGQVIGINSAKASSAEGLGFAIPINIVTPIIETVIETGTYESAYIGIAGYDLETVKAQMETTINADKGVYVYQVYANTGAADAGIQSGDVILSIDGNATDTMSSLKKVLVKYAPGDTAQFTIERDGNEMTIDLTFGKSTGETTVVGSENEQSQQNNGGQSEQPQQTTPNQNDFGSGFGGDLFDYFFGGR